MFNPVAPYEYLLHTVYFFMADIANPDVCVCVVIGLGCVSTSPAFMRSSASHLAGTHGQLAPQTVNRAPIAGGGKFRHNLHNS